MEDRHMPPCAQVDESRLGHPGAGRDVSCSESGYGLPQVVPGVERDTRATFCIKQESAVDQRGGDRERRRERSSGTQEQGKKKRTETIATTLSSRQLAAPKEWRFSRQTQDAMRAEV